MIESMSLQGVLCKAFKTKKSEIMIKIVCDGGNMMTVIATAAKGHEEALKLPFPAVVTVQMRSSNEVYSSFGDKVFKVDAANIIINPVELKKAA